MPAKRRQNRRQRRRRSVLRGRFGWWQAMVAALALACTLPAHARPHAQPGQQAPDFALRALAGPNVRLSEHIGQVVVISFWGVGCDACRAQLEALERDFTRYRAQGLRVYGVEVADDQTEALRFARGMHVTFPLLLDPTKAVARLYDIDNLPMTVLIDRDGKIRQVVRDFSNVFPALMGGDFRLLEADVPARD